MPTEEVTPQPSQSLQPSPSPSPSWAASLPAAITAGLAILVVGRPLGQALPELIREAARTRDRWAWIAVAADLLAMGLLVAPVPTVALARSLLSRLPLLSKGKE